MNDDDIFTLVICPTCDTIQGKFEILGDGTVKCLECGSYGALTIEQAKDLIHELRAVGIVDYTNKIVEDPFYIQLDFDPDASPEDDEGLN
jgi:hypothetical protein